jgi:D-alanine-D-alanine ligase-like ATP-grasp enzyme
MTRQTVLLVYGGESSEYHDASVRSARSVFAAMDGEKYDTLLCYVDQHGKWWLLERWTDNLDEHGGAQLVAALGSHSFLVLPGNALIRPDVVMLLFGESTENEAALGLVHILHLETIAASLEASILGRVPEGVVAKLRRHGIEVDTDDAPPDDRLMVAFIGNTKEPTVSTVAHVVESETPDNTLRSVNDEMLASRVQEVAVGVYGALHCRNYALITLNKRGDDISLALFDTYPELSTGGTFLKLWRMSDVRYPEVVDRLIATARK